MRKTPEYSDLNIEKLDLDKAVYNGGPIQSAEELRMLDAYDVRQRLDRIEAMLSDTIIRLSDLGDRIVRTESKLDRILTNELATNQDLLLAASGGTKGFDEILKAWGVTSD